MTTTAASRNESNMATGLAGGDSRISSHADGTQPDSINTAKEKDSDSALKTVSPDGGPEDDPEALGSQSQSSQSLPVYPYPHNSGYHFGGYSNQGVNPSSVPVNDQVPSVSYPSPANSFVPQPGVFAAAQSSPFAVPSNTTLSPPRSSKAMVGIPPASPLFPRATNMGLDNGLPYISPALGSSASPMTYQATYAGSATRIESQGSSDEGSWDRSQSFNAYPSPQLSAQGIMYAMPRGARAYSFDGETVLLPTTLDDPQLTSAYSPYNASQLSPNGGAMFATQQPWSYPGPPPDFYSTPASPLQPRPTAHHMYTIGGPMPPMGSYGVPQYFSATSPGPPIQTTASNKGPDGANLFIFHIPNNFTNMDMYNLFCRYGNLLSVRIMVERDTGRSRGFGFVSYDNPGSAAQAIQELNGYAIGNKRLKVQHKQIRSRDNQDREGVEGGSPDHCSEEGNYDPSVGHFSSMPPSGPTPNTQDLWYEQESNSVPSTLKTETKSTKAKSVENPCDESVTAASDVNKSGDDKGCSPLTDMGKLHSALPEVASVSDK